MCEMGIKLGYVIPGAPYKYVYIYVCVCVYIYIYVYKCRGGFTHFLELSLVNVGEGWKEVYIYFCIALFLFYSQFVGSLYNLKSMINIFTF